MEEESSQPPKLSLEEKIGEFFDFYKIPISFGIIGLLFLSGAIFLTLKNKPRNGGVTFSDEASGSASGRTKIKVDIEGAVLRPGVYELPSNQRIQDLLVLGGGLSSSADRAYIAKNLNLAAKLTDGGKVYIPSVNEAKSGNLERPGGTGAAAGVNTLAKININSASLSELDTLPGVGPVTAQKIISNRPYQVPEDLKNKKAVNLATFEKIKDLITY